MLATDLPKLTLLVLTYDDKILLGLKKLRFGKGKYNGFGGKLEPGETLLEGVCREATEEAGITLNPLEVDYVGILDFYFVHKPSWNQQVHLFKATHFEGIPVETDEMAPKEFSLAAIPYDKMWSDDVYWLPLVLEGKKVTASFTFNEDGSIKEHDLVVVNELPEF